MLSRSYTHINVNTVCRTQPVKIICLKLMRKTRFQNLILYGQKTYNKISFLCTNMCLNLVANKTTKGVSETPIDSS